MEFSKEWLIRVEKARSITYKQILLYDVKAARLYKKYKKLFKVIISSLCYFHAMIHYIQEHNTHIIRKSGVLWQSGSRNTVVIHFQSMQYHGHFHIHNLVFPMIPEYVLGILKQITMSNKQSNKQLREHCNMTLYWKGYYIRSWLTTMHI